ncbi:F-box protein SKIP19 [Platanthera zijinensis]|uniref:F-box protein SKIP19 n=1 Tax=Platanthera zijinensis TaxID=2320716 RepID=A0AAP0BUU5_9ASPA
MLRKSLDVFKSYKAEIENQPGKQIKAVRSDRGGEYYDKYDGSGKQLPGHFAKFLEKCGIVPQYIMLDTPTMNDVAERQNKTLKDVVRTEELEIQKLSYASVVGSLMYAQVCTFPDIAFIVGKLGRYLSNRELDHWKTAKQVMQYLKRTKTFMLTYRRSDQLEIIGATRLRGLHLIEAFINKKAFVETLRKLPLLEELELSLCSYFSSKIVERIGETCPQLKSFRFNGRAPTSFQFYRQSESRRNTVALAIAKHFKQLRRLQLFANCLTSIGLSAILDNCPDLESLDIRFCFNIGSLDESLKSKCKRIKDLRLPNDSTADYEHGVGELQTDDSYINPHFYASYFDFGCSDDDLSYFDYLEIYDWSDYDGELV